MSVYLVTGKLGTGKSKWCTRRAQIAIKEGRRVASNMDFYLDKLNPSTRKARFVRIPDKPSVRDLEAIGHGNPESYDEDRNGLLILDELGSWLNSRQSLDGARKAVVDWMIHARKLGWDVLLIVQSAMMIDKQIREGIGEYTVVCYRLDKLKIPLIGGLLSMFSDKAGKLPRLHVASTRLQLGPGTSHVVDRDFFRGDDLHAAYDTRQVFAANEDAVAHTVLSPLYFTQAPGRIRWWERFALLGGAKPAPADKPPLKPKHPIPQLLMRYPPDVRMVEWSRLQRLGALNVSSASQANLAVRRRVPAKAIDPEAAMLASRVLRVGATAAAG